MTSPFAVSVALAAAAVVAFPSAAFGAVPSDAETSATETSAPNPSAPRGLGGFRSGPVPIGPDLKQPAPNNLGAGEPDRNGPGTKSPEPTGSDRTDPTPRRPTVGYGRMGLFLQTPNGRYRFRPSVRLQAQAYAFLPSFERPGTPRDSIFVRRARPEFFGVLFDGKVQFKVVAEAAFLINGRAPAADEFVRIDLHEAFKIQFGQFSVPFTRNNRTPEMFLPFLERALVARNLGPAIKEPGAMIFGSVGRGTLFYAGGIFNGGEINTRNADNHFDFAGRTFVRPFASGGGALDRAQVGGSATAGRREKTNAPYLGGMIPSGRNWLGTAFGYRFFPQTYRAADEARTRVGLVPEGRMWRAAGEVAVPIGRVDFASEYIHLDVDIDENALDLGATVRSGGRLVGDGAYVSLGYWFVGDPRVFPDPGVPPKALVSSEAIPFPDEWHLAAFVRANLLDVRYTPGRTVFVGPLGGSQAAGRYRLMDVQGAVNLWWTQHVRFTLNYNFTRLLEGDRALLPGPGRPYLHEVSTRWQIYL